MNVPVRMAGTLSKKRALFCNRDLVFLDALEVSGVRTGKSSSHLSPPLPGGTFAGSMPPTRLFGAPISAPPAGLAILFTCLTALPLGCSGGGSPAPVTPAPAPGAGGAAGAGAGAGRGAAAPPAITLAQAGIVKDWLQPDADPCQDFYQYACGGFLATATIPPDRSSWSAITIVQKDTETFLKNVLEGAAKDPGSDPVKKKLGDYYAACMDEPAIEKAGAAPLKPYLDVIARVRDGNSAARAVVALHAAGIFPLFTIYSSQDFADATQVIAWLDQAGLGLPDRKYYLEDSGNMKKVRETYRGHVGRMFALLGRPAREQQRAVADVMRIETALARMQQDEVFRRDPHNVYHRIDRTGLEKAAPGFPWGSYLGALGIGNVTAITVEDPAYYAGLVKLLRHQRPAALRHYLTWTVLDAISARLSKAFVDEDFTMQKALRGTKELPPRWRRCVHRVDDDLGQLLAQPYVAARFAGDSKARAVELTTVVMKAMSAELGALPWMDAATRTAAQAKLAKMATLVGYPDHWRRYDFPVSRTDYAANVEAATLFEQRRQLAKIGKPVDRFDWQMTPPTVNAYYDPTLNELVLPAGQLQPPFFGAGFHPAVNFGATGGGTIGHEMTHGFDDEGRQFDGDGNLRNWWSDSTTAAFQRAATCVADQYSGYDAVPGVKLNGKLTLGENIADIGGVKLAYKAYRDWRATQDPAPPARVGGFTDDQLYFLAYGQSWCATLTPELLETLAHTNPHSPPRWRVNGVVADQPGFAEAYHCAAGTPMHPKKSCTVW